jgi:LmbE family N-acetylglucosaminyl deacetylase
MRVLAIAAHPDDETLGAGGTLARHAEQGDEVWVCILTDGVTARHNEAELQQACAVRAADVLGIKKVVFCGLPDQRLDTLPLLDVIKPVQEYVDELEPEVVYTHFKEDPNQDHGMAFKATLIATRPLADSSVRRLLCYEAASSTEWAPPFAGSQFAPNVFVDVAETLPTKQEAMQCYADTHDSEVRPYPHPRSHDAIEAYARRYGVMAGLHAAEAFMLVRERISVVGSNGFGDLR